MTICVRTIESVIRSKIEEMPELRTRHFFVLNFREIYQMFL